MTGGKLVLKLETLRTSVAELIMVDRITLSDLGESLIL